MISFLGTAQTPFGEAQSSVLHNIALAGDFADASHLSKAYRRAHGITPASTPDQTSRDNAVREHDQYAEI
jgi:transcriptional regulator GlxA family with amidase domain